MDRVKILEKQRRLLHRDSGLAAIATPNLPVGQPPFMSSANEPLPFALFTELNSAPAASAEEVQALLAELNAAFDQKRMDELFGKAKQDVLQSVVGAFGLGKVLAAYDKVGGNVDTIHNARHGVYATEKARAAFENRGDYDTDAVHGHETYKETNRSTSALRKTEGIQDAYSGDRRTAHDHVDLDHVISGRQTHDDPGRVLAGIKTEDLANVPENLAATHRSINRSKKALSPDEFAHKLEEDAAARKERIGKLSSSKDLSDQDRKELEKLTALESADPDAIREHGKVAQKAQDAEVNETYYLGNKFLGNTALTGAKEGAKVGVQQAIGVMLVELLTGVFNEIFEAFENGRQGESFLADVKERLLRIGRSVLARWKDVLEAMGTGFISGFISNLVTTIINAFVTTGRRIVRMIREGAYSLFRALKMILFPPDGMTLQEAAHEALKLVAAGGIVIGGVVLEEAVEKLILGVPFLVPIAPIVSTVIVGALSAICMALTTYLIDKLDLLNVIARQRSDYVLNTLDAENQALIEECERLATRLDDMADRLLTSS
jgi:hypothetical protein